MTQPPTPHRLVFFGTDTFSAPSLKALLSAGYNVVGVVTKPDARVGRGRELTAPPVKQLAEPRGIPVWQPTKLADIASDLQALRPDTGVVVAYGRIIPASILGLFAGGLINVHASLLPKYRGASPVEAAILNGDTKTGVTLMRIAEQMDAGDIYTQGELTLTGQEVKPKLYEDLSYFGAQHLVNNLANILAGVVPAVPQDEAAATYVTLIKKADGQLDWTKPAEQLEREVRAYLGWPGSRTTLLGHDVTVTAAHVQRQPWSGQILQYSRPGASTPGDVMQLDGGALAVTTSQDLLAIDRLKPAGKRDMSATEFMAGRR